MQIWMRFWNQTEMIIDNAFAYTVTTNIMLNDDIETHFADEGQYKQIGHNGNKESMSNSIHS